MAGRDLTAANGRTHRSRAAALAAGAAFALLVLITGGLPGRALAAALEALPSGLAERDQVTVSGVSSGGYMAMQMQVAHAAGIAGAGVIAAGPYHCAGSNFPFNLLRATNICAQITALVPFMGPPELWQSVKRTEAQALRGRIDDPAHLRADRVYLFSGRLDKQVPATVTDVLQKYYETFVTPANIAYVTNVQAAHAMVSADFGNACDTSKSPYINDCDYDAAGALLNQLYGPLAPPQDQRADGADNGGGTLVAFDQTAFDPEAERHGLGAEGYVFIPTRCQTGNGCRLHVAFHGCRQHTGVIGKTFVDNAGYNAWAAANDIIVLYPQATPLRTRILGMALPWPNPQGCWDWWGFTGRDFDVKSGPQIAAVWAMIERLTGRR